MVQQLPPGGPRKISFNVSDQYEIQDVIGEGAYGVVWYVIWIYTISHKVSNLLQLGNPQTFRSEGRYQKDYSI